MFCFNGSKNDIFNPQTTIPEGHPHNENERNVISEDEVLAAIRQSSDKKVTWCRWFIKRILPKSMGNYTLQSDFYFE
jgi:hypothetical protein